MFSTGYLQRIIRLIRLSECKCAKGKLRFGEQDGLSSLRSQDAFSP